MGDVVLNGTEPRDLSRMPCNPDSALAVSQARIELTRQLVETSASQLRALSTFAAGEVAATLRHAQRRLARKSPAEAAAYRREIDAYCDWVLDRVAQAGREMEMHVAATAAYVAMHTDAELLRTLPKP